MLDPSIRIEDPYSPSIQSKSSEVISNSVLVAFNKKEIPSTFQSVHVSVLMFAFRRLFQVGKLYLSSWSSEVDSVSPCNAGPLIRFRKKEEDQKHLQRKT